MMELEAGLAEGPRTATTPLERIWHTWRREREREEREREKKKREGAGEREKKQ